MRSILLISLLAVLWPAHASGKPAASTSHKAVKPVSPVAYSMVFLSINLPLLVVTGGANSEPNYRNFTDTYKSRPHKDSDPWAVNYVAHPLRGSEAYLRAREASYGIPGSIGFSFAESVAWEYLFESWTEHPSSQDLIFTTGIGWMLGEGRYQAKLATPSKYHFILDPFLTSFRYASVQVRGSSIKPLVRASTKLSKGNIYLVPSFTADSYSIKPRRVLTEMRSMLDRSYRPLRRDNNWKLKLSLTWSLDPVAG